MKKLIKPWQENNLLTGTSTKRLGSFIKHKDPKKLRKTFRLKKKDIVFAEQVHNNKVVVVDEKDGSKVITKVDGLVTKVGRLCLVVYTADCIPVFFYDKLNKVIGLSHAGRKGSLVNISGNTIKEMKKIGADPKHIQVHLGPHICKKCYEVNLALLNSKQLMQEGVPKSNITISEFCTFEDKDYFNSYRREKPTNEFFDEMISLILLK